MRFRRFSHYSSGKFDNIPGRVVMRDNFVYAQVGHEQVGRRHRVAFYISENIMVAEALYVTAVHVVHSLHEKRLLQYISWKDIGFIGVVPFVPVLHR